MANFEADGSSGAMESAAELRTRALELKLAEMQRDDTIKARESKKHAEFVEDFFRKHIGDTERAIIKRLVTKAAADGKFEAMIYSFPSNLCTDSGREINNAAPGWQETLQGKAREIYDLFEVVARPRGYTLRAAIINFPDGMPGDVGFFLGWVPPLD